MRRMCCCPANSLCRQTRDFLISVCLPHNSEVCNACKSTLIRMALRDPSDAQDGHRYGPYKRQLYSRSTALKAIRQCVHRKGPYLDCKALADCHIRVLSQLPLDCSGQSEEEPRFYEAIPSDQFETIFEQRPSIPWCWPEDHDSSLDIGGWTGHGKQRSRALDRAKNTSIYISHFFNDVELRSEVKRLARLSSWGGILSVF